MAYRRTINTVCYGISSAVNNVKTQRWFYLLLVLTSLMTFYGGDDARYRYFVEEGWAYYGTRDFDPLENFYLILATISGHNFFIWKIVVYVPAIILTYITTKRLRVNNLITLTAFCVFMIPSYGSTRAVLAYSIFTFAFCFLKDNNIFNILIAFTLIYLSVFTHSSMILPIVVSPFMFIKLTRKRIWMLVLFLPFAVILFNLIYPMLYSNTNFMGEQYGYKFGVYAQEETSAGSNYYASILSTLVGIIGYISLGLTVFISIKADIKKRLPKAISRITRVSFYTTYIAIVMTFSSLPNGQVISTRYIYMVPFFLYLTWPYILRENYVLKPYKRRAFILVSSSSLFARCIMIVYYGAMQ